MGGDVEIEFGEAGASCFGKDRVGAAGVIEDVALTAPGNESGEIGMRGFVSVAIDGEPDGLGILERLRGAHGEPNTVNRPLGQRDPFVFGLPRRRVSRSAFDRRRTRNGDAQAV